MRWHRGRVGGGLAALRVDGAVDGLLHAPQPLVERAEAPAANGKALADLGPIGCPRWAFRMANGELAIFAKFLQIFGGLVLGCIKTKFCKKICV